jgi:hypothetical protein
MPQRRGDRGRAVVEEKARRLQQLRVEYVPAGSVTPNLYNPNRQSDFDFELLLRSMDSDGFTQPVIVQEDSKHIVDGEHRWTGWIVLNALYAAGKVLDDVTRDEMRDMRERRLDLLNGMPELEIPVVLTDMTEAQRRISTLRHNRARGSEDVELSAQVLRDLRELGSLDMAAAELLLDDTELQILLEQVPTPEAYAADAFSESWDPAHEGDVSREGEHQTSQGQSNTSTSQRAVEVARARERSLAVANTEEERAAARRDNNVYRLICVFSNEEAESVRGFMGPRPADRIVAMVRYFQGKPETVAELEEIAAADAGLSGAVE